MPTDHSADPWSGTTYNGFSGAPTPHGAARGPAAPPRRRPSTRVLMGAGIAGAVALGLVFGLMSKPRLNTGEGPERRPMAPVTAPAAAPDALDGQAATAPDVQAEAASPTPPVPAQVQIQMDPSLAPPETRVQPAPGKIPVLSGAPRTGAAAAPRAPAQRTPVPRGQPAAPAAITPPQVRYVTPPPVAARPAPLPVPAARADNDDARPSFPCRYARSRSEQMVCGDPALAAADRRLNRAYEAAIAAGAPRRELRADQDDWMEIREDAARYSRGAVANVYEQRIDELEAMAGR